MESTAAGIDAETVIPTRRPRYAFAAPKITDSKIPRIKAVIVNSGTTWSAGIYGLKSFLFSFITFILSFLQFPYKNIKLIITFIQNEIKVKKCTFFVVYRTY